MEEERFSPINLVSIKVCSPQLYISFHNKLDSLYYSFSLFTPQRSHFYFLPEAIWLPIDQHVTFTQYMKVYIPFVNNKQTNINFMRTSKYEGVLNSWPYPLLQNLTKKFFFSLVRASWLGQQLFKHPLILPEVFVMIN